MSSILTFRMFPKADIIEQFLKRDIEGSNAAQWLTERKVISSVANHFSRLRWPENPNPAGIRINVLLALSDWKKLCRNEFGETYASGISDLMVGIYADLFTISLERFPQKLLVQMIDE